MNSEERELLKSIHYWALPRTPNSRIISNEHWLQVVSEDNKISAHNEVIYSYLKEKQFKEKLLETIKLYKDIGTAFKWCTNPFTLPSHTPEILKEHGFTSWKTSHMYLPISEVKLTNPNNAVEVQKIGVDNFDLFFDVYAKSWKIPANQIAQKRQQLLFDHRPQEAIYERYLAYLNGIPAGIGSVARNEFVGYFHGTAVLPEFQGKGVYRALVEFRLKEAKESKIKLAATVALPTSAPRLEHFGFKMAWAAEVFLKTE